MRLINSMLTKSYIGSWMETEKFQLNENWNKSVRDDVQWTTEKSL